MKLSQIEITFKTNYNLFNQNWADAYVLISNLEFISNTRERFWVTNKEDFVYPDAKSNYVCHNILYFNNETDEYTKEQLKNLLLYLKDLKTLSEFNVFVSENMDNDVSIEDILEFEITIENPDFQSFETEYLKGVLTTPNKMIVQAKSKFLDEIVVTYQYE